MDSIQGKFVSNSFENRFTIISTTSEAKKAILISSVEYDKNNQKFSCRFVNNLNDNLDIDYVNLDQVSLTHKSHLLLFYYNNELIYIDSKLGSVEARKSFNDSNSILDYFVRNSNLTNNNKTFFHQVENTDDFVGTNNQRQIVYIRYNANAKAKIQIIVNVKLESKIDQMGLFKHLLCAYSSLKNEFYVYNLKLTASSNEVYSNQVFRTSFSENKLKYACVSDDSNYVAILDEAKFLSVFRLNNGKRIAYVSLYNEINSLQMSDHFVVMAMQDKRILSYLLVDPLIPEHQNRISKLESRYFG